MRIHSDKLTRTDLINHLPGGLYIALTEHRSRKRARAFEVKLSADAGTTDAHGAKRRYSTNSGYHGGDRNGPRAATWVEYGDWMVELLKLDEQAIVGDYDSANDFIVKTQEAAPHRPDFEGAEAHADRWSEELFWHRQKAQGVVRITRVEPEELIKVCPECSSEEIERANEGRAFRCGNCGARFDNPLLAVS